MTIHELNRLDQPQLTEALEKCCGSHRWVESMIRRFPMADEETLLQGAKNTWYNCSEKDWREAFTRHPKIGDLESLKKKFAATSTWAAGEQAAVNQTSPVVLEALAKGNTLYEQRFGYIFIVCATGKSAEEMLALLQVRLPNDPAEEIKIAMEEQNKITILRLQKLLS